MSSPLTTITLSAYPVSGSVGARWDEVVGGRSQDPPLRLCDRVITSNRSSSGGPESSPVPCGLTFDDDPVDGRPHQRHRPGRRRRDGDRATARADPRADPHRRRSEHRRRRCRGADHAPARAGPRPRPDGDLPARRRQGRPARRRRRARRRGTRHSPRARQRQQQRPGRGRELGGGPAPHRAHVPPGRPGPPPRGVAAADPAAVGAARPTTSGHAPVPRHVLHELQEQIQNPDETDDLLRLGLHRLPVAQFPRLRSLATAWPPTTAPPNSTKDSPSSSSACAASCAPDHLAGSRWWPRSGSTPRS